jgi:hypothetical protein
MTHSVIAQLVGDLVLGEVNHRNLPTAELVHELQSRHARQLGRLAERQAAKLEQLEASRKRSS